MFRNSLKNFEEDPFFSGFPSNTFSLMPFEMGGSRRDQKNDDLKVSHPFQSMFRDMDSIISGMHSQMRNTDGNPDCHSFSHSSVMSYKNDGKSKPRIVQASTSTRRAPGQIKETRKTFKDSESSLEKIAIGHHIGRKGHEIEKRRRNGSHIEEENRYFEMNEDDYPAFNQEWVEKTSSLMPHSLRRRELAHSDSRLPHYESSDVARPRAPNSRRRR